MKVFSVIFVFCFLGVIISCRESLVEYKDLQGDWISVSAKRNGRLTQTLDNVRFGFSQTQEMSTNLFGEDELFRINYTYPQIEVASNKLGALNVHSFRNDTLWLSTEISGFSYDFELIRDK